MEYLIGQIRLDVFLVWIAVYRLLWIIERHADYHVLAFTFCVIKYALCAFDRHVFNDITEDYQVVSVILEVINIALPDPSVFILEPVLDNVRRPYLDRIHRQVMSEEIMPLSIARTDVETRTARSEMLINIIDYLYFAVIE